MKQDFETEELRAELEPGLGFRISSLVRLDGASALNFRAVRADDGLVFAVKCIPAARSGMYDHLVRHLEETRGTPAVSRLFERECPASFRGYRLICLSWCEGERRFPDELTSGQLAAFLDEYLRFSAAMQKASLILPADPTSEWRKTALENCRGCAGSRLRRLIENEIPADELAYRADRLGVIHGDFHHGNFLFVDGRLNGIFDLEEFCGGYPADDIVRWFVCAAEHLRGFGVLRRRALLRRFSEAVRRLPYPASDWLTAVDGLLIRKIYKKLDGRRPGFGTVLNLLYRARFYREMKRVVREESSAVRGLDLV